MTGSEKKAGLSARGILGKTVVDMETGDELGQIEGLVLEQPLRLAGLRLRRAGGEVAFLPREGINEGGEHLMVKGRHLLAAYPHTHPEHDLLDRQVITTEGVVVGQVHDLYFSPETGELQAIEVSDGLIRDLVQGRRLLPWSGEMVWGEKVIVSRKGEEKDA